MVQYYAGNREKTMFTKEEIQAALKKVTIFSGINDDGLEQIYSQCEVIQKSAKEVLITEGTEATEIFILLKGKVKIVLGLNDQPFEMLELGPGSCIGEASIMGIQNHCASVVVIEDSDFLVFPRRVLMKIYDHDKDLFSLLILNIARELARRLYRTDQVLLHKFKNS